MVRQAAILLAALAVTGTLWLPLNPNNPLRVRAASPLAEVAAPGRDAAPAQVKARALLPALDRMHDSASPAAVPAVPDPANRVSQPPARELQGAGFANTTYFAEGYTGDSPDLQFSEDLDFINTSPVTASGRICYATSTGITKTVTLAVAPYTRLVQNVVQDVGKNQAVSAAVSTDASLTVTRTITRTTGTGLQLASTTSNGESALSSNWYFAEGYTGSTFQEYVALFNPSDSPAQVMVQVFSSPEAAPIEPVSTVVSPHSRATLDMRAIVPQRSIGLLVESDQPIAAERVLYWGAGSGSGKYGSSVSPGLLEPAASWTFPYVSVANDDEAFLAFTNPSTVPANVTFTVVGLRGTATPLAPLTVQPGARATASLTAQTVDAGGPLYIIARSNVPVVAEQSQYFGGSPNAGSHTGSVVPGIDMSSRWVFSASDPPGATSCAWYVLNAGTTSVQLSGNLYTGNGQSAALQPHAIPAGTLTRVDVAEIPWNQATDSVEWISSAPVSVVQVLFDAANNAVAIVTGVEGRATQ